MQAREFYLIIREEVLGPITEEDLRAQLSSGRIARDTLGAERGSALWKPIGDLIDELEPVLRS